MSGDATASSKWWKIKLFRGMLNDIKRRAPYYWSDWRDAWDYRVVPSTVYMYFAKYGIHLSSDYLRSAHVFSIELSTFLSYVENSLPQSRAISFCP